MTMNLLALALTLAVLGQETAITKELRAAAWPLATTTPSVELSDLQPLDRFIGEAKVVGLGEATHGSREIFEMKHRLFRYLVEKHGFTVLALEAPMVLAMEMDRFVLTGEGDPADAVKAQSYWPWSTEEMRDLIVWMRAYNADPAHAKKLRVVGIDAQEPFVIWQEIVDLVRGTSVKHEALDDPLWFHRLSHEGKRSEVVALGEKLLTEAMPQIKTQKGEAYAAVVARWPEAFRQAAENSVYLNLREDLFDMQARVAPLVIPMMKVAPQVLETPNLPQKAREVLSILVKPANEQHGLSEAGLSAASQELRAFAPGKDTEAELLKMADVLEYLGLGIAVTKNPAGPRERHMAQNVEWIARDLLPGAKVAVWGFNSHISTHENHGTPLMMGAFLRQKFGDAYFPLGFAFGQGSFNATGNEGRVQTFTVSVPNPGSFDAALGRLRPGSFILPFDGLSAEAMQWLDAQRPWRNIGSSFSPTNTDRYYEPLAPGQLFRAVIYLDKVTAARPLP